jgi:secondary thiamine-phosphate synthase enzyme
VEREGSMLVYSSTVTFRTEGFADCRDITRELEQCLRDSRIVNGLLTVMVTGSTAAVTTIEYEPGAVSDLKEALERIAPLDIPYAHNERWGDGNGFAHVRAALMKPSLGIPVIDGRLCLGTWQQVICIDFDNRPRNRSLVVQVLGQKDTK